MPSLGKLREGIIKDECAINGWNVRFDWYVTIIQVNIGLGKVTLFSLLDYEEEKIVYILRSFINYSRFHIKGTKSVHSFNRGYLSISPMQYVLAVS